MTYEEATKRGQKLLDRMEGKNWKLEVSENLGWHFKVYLDLGEGWTLWVHENESGGPVSYWTLLGRFGTGEMYWAPDASYHDPNVAVRKQLDLARDFLYKRAVMLEKLEEKINNE